MKPIYPSISLLLAVLIMSERSNAQDGLSALEGPYVGQKPPGLTPEPFAPGIVTTKGFDDGGVFSTDMDEFHFIRVGQDNKIESVIYKQKNNRWFETVNKDTRLFYPFFAPDGNAIYFGKQYMERTDTGWSKVKNLASPFDEIEIMSLSVSLSGTYAFDERRPDDDGILRYSQLIDGKRETPRPFSKKINSGTRNSHPFIAPDESFIMWDGIKDSGFGNVDLYISFRQQDDSWGAAINMGNKINTEAYEAGPKVTPDGKYLFFVRNMGSDKFENVDIFWVDAKIIDTLRPK